MTVQGLTDHSWSKCIKCSFFPFPRKKKQNKKTWSQVKSQVHMRQNSTNSNKRWKHSWLKGLLVNGSILLPTFPVYACKSNGEFAIRSGPTLGLTPCTPLWLGQYTGSLLSQLWVWFRLFNFSALKLITTMWGVSVIILLVLGFGLEVFLQVL